ncbi:MAG: DNA polymerase family B elongation subunit [Harvfovirus sp.]|uniref:DNA-directed DNA polymerase n=1 Tax=Harvfovirus sp. TaxID=2487768 RepID=A0A3G5A4W4_9VIRU|nr:MAG: DNA polymerase family B elongation subunit [Harvfovirus sp.]
MDSGIDEQSVVVEFQILDWRSYHEENSFMMRLYGQTRDNKTVHVQVKKFTPYFYVEISKSWRQSQVDALIAAVRLRVFPKENSDQLKKYQIVSKYKFWGFTNYEKFNFLQLTFTNHDAMRSYERVFKKPISVRSISSKPIVCQLYESNIEPFLRFMHIRQLDAVGWVSISKYTVPEDKPTHCDFNYVTDWMNLNRVEDRTILPFTIASFDIECTSGDGTFPQANRDADQIIQIGTTFSRLGESECYFQHIITLGSCDPIPGAQVESYQTEQEVMLAWTRLIKETNPSIITGYNIVGFDLQYLKDRSKKLGIFEAFSQLSRITNEISPFKETKLASSALGENILKYYEMSGRVIIDLMKVAQRDYKLESYKLDFVAAYFIKEEINKMIIKPDETLLETKSTYGLKEEQFITIYYYDGITNNKHMDGKKFQIKQLTKNSIVVRGEIDLSVMGGGFKVFWCQAKDDISPKDIFRLQRGSAQDRAIVAKYCLQDCVLCNKLIAKLSVIINNIGMANVCNVPLSYLFMRGQGVKIFSLVAKRCREKDHLIPTFNKKYKSEEQKKKEEEEQEDKDKEQEKRFKRFIKNLNRREGDDNDVDDEEDEGGYEGAIVFPPTAGVHYEPIPVLDYASLYPKSMIEKNLSHECYVIDDAKFGNLHGYKYHIIQYTTGTMNEPYERGKLKSLLDSYKNVKYHVENILNEKVQKHIKIFDKDHNMKKRNMITEIKVDRTNITITNYETSKFAEKCDGTKGIIPGILLDLLNARKKYKDEMEAEKDPFKKSVCDGLQLAYKVTANSLYGQTGSSVSAICMKQIAASTTATGREKLIYSKLFIETIYGQLINLALTDHDEYMEYCEELLKDVPDKKFKREKNGYKTKDEFVELFEKTMLVQLVGKKVDPVVIYGDSVTGDTPILLRKIVNKSYVIEIKAIETIANCWKPYEQFKSDKKGLSEKQHDDEIEYEVFSDKGWSKIKRVIRHKTDKKIYEVLTHTGCVRVTEDHSLLTEAGIQIKPKDCVISETTLLHAFPEREGDDSDKETIGEEKANVYGRNGDKIIPTSILNASQDEKMSFLEGYFSGKCWHNCYKTKSQINAMSMYYIFRTLGYNVSIEKDEQFRLYFSEDGYEKPENLVKDIRDCGVIDDYVYDLETEAGHFHAGVGQMIVKNTDSVFFKPNIIDLITGEVGRDKKALEISIQLGIWASNTICLLLPDPQEQCYEKVMWPFMILTKKRYVGNLYETNPNKFYQKSMGIVLKRRDNAQIVKIVCGGIIDQVLNKLNPEGAVALVKTALKNILANKYPMDKFIITKTLAETYKFRERMVHAVLADRMALRDPGNKPMPNDRIPFVYVITKGDVQLQGERVEHPDYVKANSLKLDYLFYITNQIQVPAIQFLELIIDNPAEIFKCYIMREENRREGRKPIKSYFSKDDSDPPDEPLDEDHLLLNAEETIEEANFQPKKKKQTRKKIRTHQPESVDETFTIEM